MTNPKLNFVHLCDMAFLSQEGKANIIGIFKIIFANNFPTSHPKFSVITSLDFSDSIGKHKEYLEIVRGDDDNEKIGPQISFDFNVSEKNQEINLIADIVNVVFEKPGKYFVKILVDGNEVGKSAFDVIKVTQQENGSHKVEELV